MRPAVQNALLSATALYRVWRRVGLSAIRPSGFVMTIILIGLGTGFNGILSFVILLPSAHNPVSQIVVTLFALLQLGWGWVWCRRPWPSERAWGRSTIS